MGCLKYQTLDDYYKIVGQLVKENRNDDLIIEYQKNYYLSKRIQHAYNMIRSYVFIDFVNMLDKYAKRNKLQNPEVIKKACLACVEFCDTYLNIASLYENYDKQPPIEAPSKERLDYYVKKTAKRCFAYINTLEDFSISVRNYAAYLLAKFFNERCGDFGRVYHYEEELSFANDDEIKEFEKNELLEAPTGIRSTIECVLEAFYIDLSGFDDAFSLHLEILSEEKS